MSLHSGTLSGVRKASFRLGTVHFVRKKPACSQGRGAKTAQLHSGHLGGENGNVFASKVDLLLSQVLVA